MTNTTNSSVWNEWGGKVAEGGAVSDADISAELQARMVAARRDKTPLKITGGGTKDFYGRHPTGRVFTVAGHRGVVEYEPTELVITVRGGTPLREVERLLAGRNQMLAFEPPHFGEGATLGGCVACALSGPRRPYVGAVRDFVLGVKCLSGAGDILSFGGRVMKNVAGYDVSRLMAGAMGTLGVLLEVSLKVLPRPAADTTRCYDLPADQALDLMNRWAGQPLPLSGASHHNGRLIVRLSGSEQGVAAAARKLGGEVLEDGAQWWQDLREHRLAYFSAAMPLWRVSLPPAAAPLGLPGEEFLDWGGAQRWLTGDVPAGRVRERAAVLGGHATLFRHGDRRGEVFQPLAPALMTLHRGVKHAFDPDNILNPGRLYSDV
jgi:glycolate oxidase FAD binding subunit